MANFNLPNPIEAGNLSLIGLSLPISRKDDNGIFMRNKNGQRLIVVA